MPECRAVLSRPPHSTCPPSPPSGGSHRGAPEPHRGSALGEGRASPGTARVPDRCRTPTFPLIASENTRSGWQIFESNSTAGGSRT